MENEDSEARLTCQSLNKCILQKKEIILSGSEPIVNKLVGRTTFLYPPQDNPVKKKQGKCPKNIGGNCAAKEAGLPE